MYHHHHHHRSTTNWVESVGSTGFGDCCISQYFCGTDSSDGCMRVCLVESIVCWVVPFLHCIGCWRLKGLCVPNAAQCINFSLLMLYSQTNVLKESLSNHIGGNVDFLPTSMQGKNERLPTICWFHRYFCRPPLTYLHSFTQH